MPQSSFMSYGRSSSTEQLVEWVERSAVWHLVARFPLPIIAGIVLFAFARRLARRPNRDKRRY